MNRRRRVLLVLILGLLVLILGGASWKAARLAVAARDAHSEAQHLRATVVEARQAPADLQAIHLLEPRLTATGAALRHFQNELGPLNGGMRLLRFLPSSLDWLSQIPDVVAWAAPLTEAGALVGRSLDPATIQAGSQDLSVVVNAVSGVAPAVLGRLAEAEMAAHEMDPGPLRGPLQPVGPLLAEFQARLPLMRGGLRLASVMGTALGFEGPRTYLILGQNHRELRATGGFIGTTGLLTVDHGSVISLDYGSSYVIDDGRPAPEPPRPLSRYLGIGRWYLRDANWWPDFPSSAAQVLKAWEAAGRAAPDGVVAFDMTLITGVIDVLGGLDLPPFGHLDGASFERVAADQLYLNDPLSAAGGYHAAKAAFLAPVARTLVARLITATPRELLAVGGLLAQLADEKHLQMVSRDANVAGVLAESGWDGAIRPGVEDSLFVVDTTVSYGDSFFFINPRTHLDITIEPSGRQLYRLQLDYRNRFPEGMPDWMHPLMLEGTIYDPASRRLVGEPGFWGDWLRVYLPTDATAVRVEGLLDTPPGYVEAGRWVQAGFLPMGPGQERAVTLYYERPPAQQHAVTVWLQKQAGTECRDTTIIARWPGDRVGRYDGCPHQDLLVTLARPNR